LPITTFKLVDSNQMSKEFQRWPNLFANYLKIVLLSRLKLDRNFCSTEKDKFRSRDQSWKSFVLLTKILSIFRSFSISWLILNDQFLWFLICDTLRTISYFCLEYNHLWVFLANFYLRSNVAIKTSSTSNVFNKFVSFLLLEYFAMMSANHITIHTLLQT
jgi:hypothetical protein